MDPRKNALFCEPATNLSRRNIEVTRHFGQAGFHVRPWGFGAVSPSWLLCGAGWWPRDRRRQPPVQDSTIHLNSSAALTPSAIANFSMTVIVGLRAPRSMSET